MDQDVDAAVGVDDLLHQPLRRLGLGELDRMARPLVPHVRDPLQRLLGVLRLAVAEVRDRDVGPFAGERDRDRASDDAVASGDERDAVTEPPVAHVAVLAVIGRRKQVGLDTGVLLHLLGKRWLLARCPRIGLRRHETLPPRCP